MVTSETATSAPPAFDPQCASYHFGLWAIEPEWFKSAVSAVRNGIWPARAEVVVDEAERPKQRGYVVRSGVAIVPIAGPMMKARSKYGGTSTVDVRTAIRQAVTDDSASSILILIDSPGGTVAGTESLAQDIAAADQRKPVYAHIEDLGASAAYWAASQARKITVSPTSMVGSLGAMMALDDFSKRYEMLGVKAIVVSSGGMKGAGTEGTEITEAQLAYFQGLVDDSTQHFKNAVIRGREMSAKAVDEIFDGRVHDAVKAKSLGLVDAVVSLDSAMSEILADMEIEEDDIDAGKKKAAIDLIKNTKLGAVAMNPEELLASIAPPTIQTQISAPELPRRSGALPDISTKETSPMSTETIEAPAQAPAAEIKSDAQVAPALHPLRAQEIQGYVEQGRVAGMKQGAREERERCKAIADACPGKPQMALGAFLKEQSPDAVKMAFEAAAAAETAAEQRIAAMQEAHQREVAMAAAGGYPGGVGVSLDDETGEAVVEMTLEAAKEAAGKEWDRNVKGENGKSVRHGFSSKNNYVNFRSAQLRGQFNGRAQQSA